MASYFCTLFPNDRIKVILAIHQFSAMMGKTIQVLAESAAPRKPSNLLGLQPVFDKVKGNDKM